jgi:hypothetical protein
MTRANRLLKEELLEVKLTSMEKEEKCLLKIIGKEKKNKKKLDILIESMKLKLLQQQAAELIESKTD